MDMGSASAFACCACVACSSAAPVDDDEGDDDDEDDDHNQVRSRRLKKRAARATGAAAAAHLGTYLCATDAVALEAFRKWGGDKAVAVAVEVVEEEQEAAEEEEDPVDADYFEGVRAVSEALREALMRIGTEREKGGEV
jgi:hypothetical protein